MRLVCIHYRRVNTGRVGVALQTQEVNIAVFQQVRVRASVRHMACTASLHPHGLVLEYERSLLVRVALEANKVAGR